MRRRDWLYEDQECDGGIGFMKIRNVAEEFAL